MSKKIAVVSLGCDKNRVDTEKMLYLLQTGGHILTENYDEADVIIINTCAFIQSARVESIETILQMAEYKKSNCQKLIVSGCLPQKYSDEIYQDLKEVDAFLGTKDYETICSVIDKLFINERVLQKQQLDSIETTQRIITTAPHYAFLKIADGCDNHCTFCTIPSIRGKYTSKSIDTLLTEAGELIENGVKEIILVAQDVTRYGVDIYKKPSLITLLKKLSELNVKQIRLMYCYPELVTDELINEIDTNEKIAKYIDVPLQHYDNSILRLMNRKSRAEDIDILIKKLRSAKNYIAIRTTLMVGFPTETDESFNNLLNFVKRAKLDHIGVFAYSKEDDTVAGRLKGMVTKKQKLQRVNAIGRQHLENVIERNKTLIGRVLTVLNEDIDFDRQLFKGRTEYNAPDIDTVVYYKGRFAEVGEYYSVKITGYDNYDLLGEIIE